MLVYGHEPELRTNSSAKQGQRKLHHLGKVAGWNMRFCPPGGHFVISNGKALVAFFGRRRTIEQEWRLVISGVFEKMSKKVSTDKFEEVIVKTVQAQPMHEDGHGDGPREKVIGQTGFRTGMIPSENRRAQPTVATGNGSFRQLKKSERWPRMHRSARSRRNGHQLTDRKTGQLNAGKASMIMKDDDGEKKKKDRVKGANDSYRDDE